EEVQVPVGIDVNDGDIGVARYGKSDVQAFAATVVGRLALEPDPSPDLRGLRQYLIRCESVRRLWGRDRGSNAQRDGQSPGEASMSCRHDSDSSRTAGDKTRRRPLSGGPPHPAV